MGIDIIRISPQKTHFGEIVAAFDGARRGEPVRADASGWNVSGLVDGYWFGEAGIIQRRAPALEHPGARA